MNKKINFEPIVKTEEFMFVQKGLSELSSREEKVKGLNINEVYRFKLAA